MKLSAPKSITWLIAVIVGVVGFFAEILPIAILAPYAFLLVVVAFVLLALATLLKGL
ncbi:MAG: hypothetical protein ABIG43_03540 [Chloroflexota bacterium]